MIKRGIDLMLFTCAATLLPYLTGTLAQKYINYFDLPHRASAIDTMLQTWILGMMLIGALGAAVAIIYISYQYIRYGKVNL